MADESYQYMISQCNLEELHEILNNMDKEKYPDRYCFIKDRIEEIEASQVEKMTYTYAGFWRRFCAMLLDVIIQIPIALVSLQIFDGSNIQRLLGLVFGIANTYFFYVYCVYKWGGSPGKIILNTHIMTTSHQPISIKQALIRYSVEFSLSTLLSAISIHTFWNFPYAKFTGIGIIARGRLYKEMMPDIYNFFSGIMTLWMYGEFLTMLFNKQKRAIHDLMAGTIVVHKKKSYT